MGEIGRALLPVGTALWEQVGAATAGHPPYERVYTSPAWEVPDATGARHADVWKLAVLERRLTGGAEHWGHLYVIYGKDARALQIRPEGGTTGDRDRPAAEALPVSAAGVPLEIRIRPRSEETAVRLRAFARDFQRRTVELLTADDGPGAR
ncbi:MAG TPA: hypothetical protein VKT21_07230 [Thermoplasmata archaeon]|nr:hypothetical protein [Thermoplasmata archaeon]